MKPVVFDLDGTLIDSAPDIHAAVNATLRDHGIAPLGFDRVRSFIGRGVDHLWSEIAGVTGSDPAQTARLKTGFMTRYHDATGLTRLYPGVIEALGALASLGHPLGICTNKPLGPTRAILDHFGVAQMFSVVIGGDSLPQRKPDPAPLHAAFSMLGGHGVYVGDSEVDAETALAVGVPFLLYTRGYRKTAVDAIAHHADFDDFAALPALIRNTYSILEM